MYIYVCDASKRPCACSYFRGGGCGAGGVWCGVITFFSTSAAWYIFLHFHAAGRSLALPHIRHATLLDVLALPHIRHATLLDILLRFHTYIMLRCWTFSCTSTPASCYAAGRSLALPHLRHATLLDVLLHFHTCVMLRCWMFSCTSTHTSCYAAGRSLPKKELFQEALGTQNYSFAWENTRFSNFEATLPWNCLPQNY